MLDGACLRFLDDLGPIVGPAKEGDPLADVGVTLLNGARISGALNVTARVGVVAGADSVIEVEDATAWQIEETIIAGTNVGDVVIAASAPIAPIGPWFDIDGARGTFVVALTSAARRRSIRSVQS